MDIRFLESLIAVVETGSIAAAARKQGLTAAALSGRIKTLEVQLDAKLLSRSAHAAKPTAACLNLLPRAQKLIKQAHLLKFDIDDTGLSSRLHIGCIATALTQFVPSVIEAIQTKAPRAELLIKPGASSQLYNLLVAQKIDAAITTAPHFELPKSIHATILSNQQLVLVRKYPSQASLKNQLLQSPFIAYDKTSWGGSRVYQSISQLNFKKNILCELDSLETITELVDENLGIAILPEWPGLYKHFKHLDITPLNELGHNLPHRQIVFLSHTLSEPQKLLEIAKNSIIASL
ncbi:MAG: LysR family transcriptional regulator [Rhizobiales bacterium]|nr:LysR family transcriptional regulator [Hyphomicrobiales bacterium]NRB13788.1 LysR family transcriptional regulator [Hyphomicrobiales bacterium]